MLKVRTRLAESPLHGIGCFAAEPISSGTIIWSFSPGLDLFLKKSDILVNYSTITMEYLYHYLYPARKNGFYILCMDNARYMNHSEDANSAFVNRCQKKHKKTEYQLVAFRNINIGEEITQNYKEFSGDDSSLWDELRKLTGIELSAWEKEIFPVSKD